MYDYRTFIVLCISVFYINALPVEQSHALWNALPQSQQEIVFEAALLNMELEELLENVHQYTAYQETVLKDAVSDGIVKPDDNDDDDNDDDDDDDAGYDEDDDFSADSLDDDIMSSSMDTGLSEFEDGEPDQDFFDFLEKNEVADLEENSEEAEDTIIDSDLEDEDSEEEMPFDDLSDEDSSLDIDSINIEEDYAEVNDEEEYSEVNEEEKVMDRVRRDVDGEDDDWGWNDDGNFEAELENDEEFEEEFEENDGEGGEDEGEEQEEYSDAEENNTEQEEDERISEEDLQAAADRLEPSSISGCRSSEYDNIRLLVCEGESYEFHPSHIPSDITHLIIQATDISQLSEGHLENLGELRSLTIEDCGLQEVENGAFHGLNSLSQVSFRNNRLTNVPHEAFQIDEDQFLPLTLLELSENYIERIEAGDFNDIKDTIEELYLGGNGIEALDCDSFHALDHLLVLDLTGNHLTSFSACLLEPLPNLIELVLKSNNLESLDENNFSNSPLLTLIDVEDNAITSMSSDSLYGLSYLTTLELTGNQLDSIPSALHAVHSSLERLYIAENPICSIPGGSFEDFESLLEVSFYNCSLVEIESDAFADMHNLVELDLGYNEGLTVLPPSSMPQGDLSKLTVLRLDHTNLTTIDEDMLTGLQVLTDLYVNDMGLHCNCELQWIKRYMEDQQFPWAARWALHSDETLEDDDDYSGPSCYTPDNMRGLVIRDIYQEDLTCDPPVIDTANEEDVNVRASEGSDVTISATMRVGYPTGVWLLPNGDVVQPNQEPVVMEDGTTYEVLEQMDEEDHSVVSMLYISNIHMEASGTYSLMVTNADNAETKDFMVAVGDYEEEYSDEEQYFDDDHHNAADDNDEVTEEEMERFDDGFQVNDDDGYSDEFQDGEQLFDNDDTDSDDTAIFDDLNNEEDGYFTEEDGDHYGLSDEDFQNLDDGYSQEEQDFVEPHIFDDGEGYDEENENEDGFFDDGAFEDGGEFQGEDQEEEYFEQEEEAEEEFFDELEREAEELEEEQELYDEEHSVEGDDVFSDPYADGRANLQNGFVDSQQYNDFNELNREEDGVYTSNNYEENDDSFPGTKLGFAVLGLTVGMIVLAVGWVFYSRSRSPQYPMTSEYEKLTPGDMSMYGSDVFMDEEEDSM